MLQKDKQENKLQKELERQVRVAFFKAAEALSICNINKDIGKLYK